MMNIRRHGLFLLLGLASAGPLLPRADDVVFQRIPLEQKLSQSVVSGLRQDRYGFLWIATLDGLNLYDGTGFQSFKHELDNPASLSNNSITAICEGLHGGLWIATEGGLNRYDLATSRFTHYHHDPANPRSLSHDMVLGVYEDRQGVLWAGTGRGLDRLDRKVEAFSRYQHDPANPASIGAGIVRTIYEDREGGLWVGTDSGLNKFDRQAGVFRRYPHDPRNPGSLPDGPVTALYEDSQGALWIGTSRGLHKLVAGDGRKSSAAFLHFRHDPGNPASLSQDSVAAIFEDRAGRLWVGTDRGLNRMDKATGGFTRYLYESQNPKSLNSDRVTAIMEDRSGILWVGTYGGGVNKVVPTSGIFEHDKSDPGEAKSPFADWIYAVAEDRFGAVWAGTEAGLKRLEAGGSQSRSLSGRGLPELLRALPNIRAVAVDPSGSVWIGSSSQGLFAFDPIRQAVASYRSEQQTPGRLSNNNVSCLLPGADGILWVGTWGGGLNRFDPATKTFTVFQPDPAVPGTINDRFIHTIHEDKQGALWIGTYRGGLNRVEAKDSTFRHFLNDPADAQSLSDNHVISIREAQDGALWVGTYGGGLNKLDPKSGRFVRYSEKDGLPNGVIYGILEDESGLLWISTNNGLSKLDPRTGVFRNYFVEDGLQNNEFNIGAAYKNPKGRMFFGGINGLTSFFPGKVVSTSYVPPIVITAIKKMRAPGGTAPEALINGPFEGQREISLARKDLPLSIVFVLLDFQNPVNNRYAYRLEGRDKGWNDLGGQRTVILSALEAGDYVFKVKGANSGGVWNEAGAAVRIHVMGPSRLLTAALAFAGGLVLLAALAVLIRRLRRGSVPIKREVNWDKISRDYKITKREQEILGLILEGKRNEDIAQALFISGGTVRIHLSHIYQKLNVKNRQQAINLIIIS